MNKFTESSGNVFQDLELENADEELEKCELSVKIMKIIKEKNLGLSSLFLASEDIDFDNLRKLKKGLSHNISVEKLRDIFNKLTVAGLAIGLFNE